MVEEAVVVEEAVEAHLEGCQETARPRQEAIPLEFDPKADPAREEKAEARVSQVAPDSMGRQPATVTTTGKIRVAATSWIRGRALTCLRRALQKDRACTYTCAATGSSMSRGSASLSSTALPPTNKKPEHILEAVIYNFAI